MIEFLTEEILEEALDFAEKSHQYSAWKDYIFNRDVLRSNLKEMIGKSKYFTCIYRKDGKIIGYFFATLGQFLFSDVLLGMENGIFIEPEHRGGLIAIRMWKEFFNWCQRHNAEPFVDIYFGNDTENEKVYSFFRKLGMIECGRAFRGGRNVMCNNS